MNPRASILSTSYEYDYKRRVRPATRKCTLVSGTSRKERTRAMEYEVSTEGCSLHLPRYALKSCLSCVEFH